jgi:oxygen-independent coproporphyrinogen III oxidase
LEGIDTTHFATATGYAVEQLGGDALPALIDRGLLSLDGPRLKLTRAGLLLSDAIWPEFLRV